MLVAFWVQPYHFLGRLYLQPDKLFEIHLCLALKLALKEMYFLVVVEGSSSSLRNRHILKGSLTHHWRHLPVASIAAAIV